MKPGIKIWIEKDELQVIGGGRYKLLKAIKEEGSLKKAAEKLGYSYRYAWGNIKKIEERFGEDLIISHKGGSHGGDSKLTACAERLLEKFEEYQDEMKRLSVKVYRRILEMTSYKKAFKYLDELKMNMPAERIPLFESAGRVLAENIRSDIDMPLFNKSAMDGIALRYDDIADNNVFSMIQEISAGCFSDNKLKKGECVRIMTGAPVPEGADTVIRKEYLEGYESNNITVVKEEPKGANIALFGEDFRKGEILLEKGTAINEFVAGTAATAGRTHVNVYMLPTVVYFSTGDEVEEPEVPLRPGMIRNSNAYSVISGLRAKGLHAVYGGIVRDKDDSLEEIFKEYSGKFDIIILSGGVSEGNRDLVPEAALKAGFETVWHKLDIKPGKPQLLARRGSKFLFGLPGNPVSTTLSLYLFVYPFIARITGKKNIRNCTLVGRIEGKIKRLKDRTHFMAAKVEIKSGKVIFTTVPTNGSGDIKGASKGNGYVIVPPFSDEFDENNAEGFRLS